MSARDSLAVQSGPGDAASRRAQPRCGFCSQPWFGDVAWCPYCGRKSASAPADAGPASGDDAAAQAHVGGPDRDATTHVDALAQAASVQTGASPVQPEPDMAAFAEPDETRATAAADEPAVPLTSRVPWKSIVTVATALLFIAIVVKELAFTTGDKAGPQRATHTPAEVANTATEGPPTTPRADNSGSTPDTSGTNDRSTAQRYAPTATLGAPGRSASPPPAPPPARSRESRVGSGTATPPSVAASNASATRRSLCSVANEAAGLCKPQ